MRRTDVCAVTEGKKRSDFIAGGRSEQAAYRKHNRYSMHTGGIRCMSSFRSTFLWSTEVETTSTVTFSAESFSSSAKEEDIVEVRLPRMNGWRAVRFVPDRGLAYIRCVPSPCLP